MNLAQFLINGTPAPGGYDAETNEELVFALAPGLAALCNRWTLAVYDPADSESPLASLDAPPLTLTGATTGLKVDASTPSANITATAPASGVHSWIVRSTVDGGLNPATGKLDPNRVFERMVVLRSAGGRRKIVPTEGSQYSPRGWADAQNEDVDSGGTADPLTVFAYASVASGLFETVTVNFGEGTITNNTDGALIVDGSPVVTGALLLSDFQPSETPWSILEVMNPGSETAPWVLRWRSDLTPRLVWVQRGNLAGSSVWVLGELGGAHYVRLAIAANNNVAFGVPNPPPAGTYTLKAIDGVLTWVADS